MRFLGSLVIAALLLTNLASGQAVDTSPKKNAGAAKDSKLPMYRPILLGEGADSLTNRIDTRSLIEHGQGDAAVMFACVVRKDGQLIWSGTYRGTPNSTALEQELQKRLAPATNTKFYPAIFNHQPVDAIYYGTVMFSVVKGKPRLRIYSNQESAELEREADFIGPQPFFGPESHFAGLHYPSKEDAPVEVKGVVELRLSVDENGWLKGMDLVSEEPPFSGFGDAALRDFDATRFIPAFRNGKPAACLITLPVYYQPKP
jgi:hypothetical protein